MSTEEKEPRFVVEADLKTEPFQEDLLNIRFDLAKKLKNRCKYEMEENLRYMKKDEDYLYWIGQPKSKERSHILNDIRDFYHLSKEGAERIIKPMAKEYVRQATIKNRPKKKKKVVLEDGTVKMVRQKRKRTKTKQPHIDSATAQSLASDVWDAFDKLLFGKGKKVNYKKFGQVNTISSKSNNAGIRYRNGVVE